MTGSLRLRPATIEDARQLLEWANAADSLAQKGRTTAPISWETHKPWFEARLADPACRIEIIEIDGVPAGQVRLEPKAGGLHVDIYVVPEQRGARVAGTALSDLLGRVRNRPVIAEVKTGNAASRRLFERLGFAEYARDAKLITYRLEDQEPCHRRP